jgi:UrcA family protein
MDTNLPSSKANDSIVMGVFSTILSVGAVLWVIGGAAGVATAQTSPARAETARAAYSDLDLSTEDGARTLLRRINVAAHEACGENVHSPLLPRTATQHDRCVAAATRTAVDSVNSLTVAQVHRSETARTLVAAR